MLKVRRESLSDRTDEAARIINQSDEPWIIWCNLNDESEQLKNKISFLVIDPEPNIFIFAFGSI